MLTGLGIFRERDYEAFERERNFSLEPCAAGRVIPCG